MSLSKRQAQTFRFLTLSMLLAAPLSACADQPLTILNVAPCSSLLPDEWATTGVASASLPAGKSAGDWIAFGDAQTGQLDIANSRTQDAIKIVKNCETRDQAVQQSLKPQPWWHFFWS